MRISMRLNNLLIVSRTILFCAALLLAGDALAGRGGNGNGQGGGGGGGDNLTNPAFVYGDAYDQGLFLATADGATTMRLTKPPRKGGDRSAAWSPDGTRIAFLRHPDAGKIWADLYTIHPDGTNLTFVRAFDDPDLPIPSDTTHLTWSPDGSMIVYPSSKQLWAVNVSTGALRKVFDHLSLPDVSDWVADPDCSPDLEPGTPGYQGELAFTASTGTGETYQMDIWLLQVQIDLAGQLTTGALTNLTDSPSWNERPAWSPDGNYLACTVLQETLDSDLVVVDLQDNITWSVLTGVPSLSQPDWSPDGELLAFSAWHQPRSAATEDVFLVSPWDPAPTAVNVTRTDGGNDREINPIWNSNWTNDLGP